MINMVIRTPNNSLKQFIESLQKPTIAKVLRTLDLLEEFGQKLSFPHAKKISARIFELRISGKQEIRIFYTFHKSEIILLHGFVKKSQKISPREIEAAHRAIRYLDTV